MVFFFVPANGLFSSISAYKLVRNSSPVLFHPSMSMVSWKQLWKLKLNDRLKLFL